MPTGIRLCLVAASAHHSNHVRVLHQTESRTAFLFRDLAATYKSPVDLMYFLHYTKPVVKQDGHLQSRANHASEDPRFGKN